jgi:hypothetical protein
MKTTGSNNAVKINAGEKLERNTPPFYTFIQVIDRITYLQEAGQPIFRPTPWIQSGQTPGL